MGWIDPGRIDPQKNIYNSQINTDICLRLTLDRLYYMCSKGKQTGDKKPKLRINQMPTNKQVVQAFIKGKATNRNKNLFSDGKYLYSYSLKIAEHVTSKVPWQGNYINILDYMAPNNVSATTSQHVSLTKRTIESSHVTGLIFNPHTNKLTGSC